MKDVKKGILFDEKLMSQIRKKFLNIEIDPVTKKERLYFDNAGGSFRLKNALEEFKRLDSIPDCPERYHDTAVYINKIINKGTEDIKTIFGAKNGSIITELTASQVIFTITGTIAENAAGTNIVTTALDHPSAFDSCEYFAKKINKELRVAKTNPETGGVDVEEIIKLIDRNTCLLSVIYASNISGTVLDIEKIAEEARKIKPDLYIITDSVQHIPHGAVDINKLNIDGMNFAPYKVFGVRGSGIGYVSERVANLPHRKLAGKAQNEWKLGSPAPGHYAVITEIVDYICWIGKQFTDSNDRRKLYVEGMNRISLHERALMHRMLEGSDEQKGLRHINNVRVNLDTSDLTGRDLILGMSFDNIGHSEAVKEYEKRDVIVFERISSSIYSKRMLESFGIEGIVRVSPLHCNNINEIDRFLKVTEEIAEL